MKTNEQKVIGMQKRKIGKVINIVLLVWFVCIVLFWHFDLSKGAFGFYDTFTMAPYAVFHLTVFYTLALFAIFFNSLSLYHVLLLGLYFPLIQLVNYPYLTIRDVYLHSAPVQTILENGRLVYPQDPRPESWPASFNLHGVLSTVLGCDLINANYVLYLFLLVSFIIILYSFAKMLEKKGYKLATYTTILFLCLFFNHLFDNFHHFSRTALGFAFLLLFIVTFLCFHGRRGYLLQLLTAIATLTTHPFQSFALVIFATSYFVLARKSRRTNFMLLSVVAFAGWFLFNGSLIFYEGIDRLKTFFSPQYVEPLIETLASSEALPWWGVILRDFFKYSLVTLLGFASLAAILTLYKKRTYHKHGSLLAGVIALLPMSMIMLIGLLLFSDWQISRFTAFAAFPAAFSSFILLDDLVVYKKAKISSYKLKLLNRKTLAVLLLFFIITLSAVVMVLRFERNYYFGELNHPTELSSLSFFFSHDRGSTVNIVSWRTAVYSAFFNYKHSHQTLRLWYTDLDEIGENSSKLLMYQNQLINQSHSVIRGIRDEFDFRRVDSSKTVLKTIDEKIVGEFNQVYSNEYYIIYSRPHNPP